MKKKKKKVKKRIAIKKMRIVVCLCIIAAILIFIFKSTDDTVKLTKAMQVVDTYMSYINDGKYDEMYEMLSESSKKNITKSDFIDRNESIYGKIEASLVSVSDMTEEEEDTRESKDYLF